MREDLTITPVTAADRDAAIELLAKQLAEHRIKEDRSAIIAAVDGILLDDRRGFLLVAKEADAVVGVAYVSFTWTLEHGGASCWLEELYALPNRRGDRIGTQLLTAVLGRAKATGCAAVDLEISHEHRRAGHLYSREGFHPLHRARWVRPL